ncbi:polysaccharide pyruvyl transferase family protein [Microbacterium sp. ET2]|uniref:polysaccharide pyruvyl transferase family protein n=1 Tax=Microbacterium albipurpureum TaxID=3050384 RepID=UPI00259CD522|nr:polysaccharide pyruvyl transferase family protein [Microbacterium sp. ET2 (Ac-2212)]WJL96504.1 polysaccharide pyruvyl transferase family protein [Microbacterium sp. ET2 (Ac-2212)]
MDVLTIGDVGVLGGVIHIGDEAMFEVAAVELSARGGRVVGVSSAPEESTERYGLGAVGRLGFTGLERAVARERASLLRAAAAGEAELAPGDPAREALDALGDASGVLIAGGGNLASRWPVHVYERTTLAAMAHARGLPVVVSGQTFGPDLDVEDAERICVMTREAAWTGVREHDSAALARSWGARVHAGVDDASFLAGGAEAPTEPYVLVSLSGWFAGRPADVVEAGIARLLDAASDTVGPVIFHAHFGPVSAGAEPVGDAALHERVRERMTRESRVLPSGDSRGAAALARRARLLVTSRYHPAVFAAPAGVPIVGLAADDYTRIKLGGALGHWGQTGVVDLDDLGGAAERLRELHARRGEIAEAASARFDAHRADAVRWWDTVAESLQ